MSIVLHALHVQKIIEFFLIFFLKIYSTILWLNFRGKNSGIFWKFLYIILLSLAGSFWEISRSVKDHKYEETRFRRFNSCRECFVTGKNRRRKFIKITQKKYAFHMQIYLFTFHIPRKCNYFLITQIVTSSFDWHSVRLIDKIEMASFSNACLI